MTPEKQSAWFTIIFCAAGVAYHGWALARTLRFGQRFPTTPAELYVPAIGLVAGVFGTLAGLILVFTRT